MLGKYSAPSNVLNRNAEVEDYCLNTADWKKKVCYKLRASQASTAAYLLRLTIKLPVNSERLMHKQHKVEPNQMCVVWLKSPQLPVSAFWVLDTILNLLCPPTNLITSPL